MKSTIIYRGFFIYIPIVGWPWYFWTINNTTVEPNHIDILSPLDTSWHKNSFHKFSAQYHRIYRNTKLTSTCINMGGSKHMGTPKWMVKIMENPIKMDDLGGKPTIFGNIHITKWPKKRQWHHTNILDHPNPPQFAPQKRLRQSKPLGFWGEGFMGPALKWIIKNREIQVSNYLEPSASINVSYVYHNVYIIHMDIYIYIKYNSLRIHPFTWVVVAWRLLKTHLAQKVVILKLCCFEVNEKFESRMTRTVVVGELGLVSAQNIILNKSWNSSCHCFFMKKWSLEDNFNLEKKNSISRLKPSTTKDWTFACKEFPGISISNCSSVRDHRWALTSGW